MKHGDSHVASNLRLLAELYDKKNNEYGDSYKRMGHIMKAFFPDGVRLISHEDFARYNLFEAVIGKMNRYASNFHKEGHADSLDDAAVYAQMLDELDTQYYGSSVDIIIHEKPTFNGLGEK